MVDWVSLAMMLDGSVLLLAPGDVRVEQAVRKMSPSVSSRAWQILEGTAQYSVSGSSWAGTDGSLVPDDGTVSAEEDEGARAGEAGARIVLPHRRVGPTNAVGVHGCFAFTSSAGFASGSWASVTSASSSGSVTFISARRDDTAKPRGMAKLVLEEA